MPDMSEVKNIKETPVPSRRDLIDYLARGCKPPAYWRIGAEIEKLVVAMKTAKAAPFARIEKLLFTLEQSGRWQGVYENNRLIGLQGGVSSITLEPGGQLELSGQLCPDVHCCIRNFCHHIDTILKQAIPLGLTFLGLGVQPFSTLEEIDWLPKNRYQIMAPYMLKTGTMGQNMMKQTAGIQLNFDFEDETDCMEKMRLCLALAPLLYAWSANSPIMGGRPTGFLNTRREIWAHTDPRRAGLIHALFEPGAGFATYVDYALDVPMYFIFRDHRYLDFTQKPFTFRRYLEEGWEGQRATIHDWALHLSTLFPETRLRPQIEIRSFDSLPPRISLSFAALCKGLLYDREAREQAWALLRQQDRAGREDLLEKASRLGLKAPFENRTLRELALEILELARTGLKRQGQLNAEGEDETVFLDKIEDIARSGETLAERLLKKWRGSTREKVALLHRHCGFDYCPD
jgi:glutamate--cysteine ligase